jgi:hypothetical protein
VALQSAIRKTRQSERRRRADGTVTGELTAPGVASNVPARGRQCE